jgi:hypothetical protein
MAEEISIIDELKRLIDRTPFQPYVITLSSGERFDITERHQVAVGTSVVIVLPPNQASIYLRSNQITSVQVLAPA